MAWKQKNKKKKTLSYADQLAVKKMIEDSKSKRKTLKGHAILKRDGSQVDLKMSGVFKDIDELKQCANDFAQKLSEKSGKKWSVIEVIQNGVEISEDEDSN